MVVLYEQSNLLHFTTTFTKSCLNPLYPTLFDWNWNDRGEWGGDEPGRKGERLKRGVDSV